MTDTHVRRCHITLHKILNINTRNYICVHTYEAFRTCIPFPMNTIYTMCLTGPSIKTKLDAPFQFCSTPSPRAHTQWMSIYIRPNVDWNNWFLLLLLASGGCTFLQNKGRLCWTYTACTVQKTFLLTATCMKSSNPTRQLFSHCQKWSNNTLFYCNTRVASEDNEATLLTCHRVCITRNCRSKTAIHACKIVYSLNQLPRSSIN